MNCSNCQESAVVEIKWKNKKYCANHFRRYFLAQVGKVLDKYEVSGKIAVALSAGKDSSVCAETLTHYDRIDVELFHIDLGIGSYSEESLEVSEQLSDYLDLDFNVIDLKEEYGKTIPEVNNERKGKSCGLCGMIKRYLMNKFAYENGFDYVCTGHNLSDQVTSTFNNLANVYLTPFRGLKPVLEEIEEYKMAARVKPLYFLKDRECLVYAETNDLPYYHGVCPLSLESPTNELKEWLHKLDSDKPGILRNFAKSFIRIEEKMGRDKEGIRNCENCGYPTATRVCKFCRVMEIEK